MARTVGFSLGKEEEARLDRLVNRRGSTNRSRFLREALEVMERYDRVRDLEALQAYGELRAVAAGVGPDEIPGLVARVATADDGPLRQRADQMLNALRYDEIEVVRTTPAPLPAAQAFLDDLSPDDGQPGVEDGSPERDRSQ